MNNFGFAQPLSDQIEVALRRRYSPGGLLLECMENVEHALETNGVYGAISIAIEVIADLNNAAAKAFQSLRTGGVFSELGFEQRLTKLLTDRPRECPQVASAGPDEHRRFDQAQDIAHDAIIVVLL